MVVKSTGTKMRTKFLLAFALVILIAVAILSVPSYLSFRQIMLESSSRYSQNLTNQVQVSIFLVVTRLEGRISARMQGFGQTVFRLIADNATDLDRRIAVNNFLTPILFPSIGFDEIHFFSPWKEVYTDSSVHLSTDHMELLSQAVLRSQSIIERYWGEFQWFSIAGIPDRLFLARSIYQPGLTRPIGIVVASVRRTYLESFFDGYDAESGGNIAAFNREGGLVYVNQPENVMPVVNALPETISPPTMRPAQIVHTADGDLYQVTWAAFADRRIAVAHILDLGVLQQQISRIQTLLIMATASAVAAATFGSFVISRRITHRVSLLVENARYIEDGHFSARVPDLGSDEFGELAIAFNRMASSLSDTLDQKAAAESRLRESEIRAVRAEYEALQMQINPHFLYNALESMNSLAKLAGQNDIAETAEALASLFRRQSGRAGIYGTVSEEIGQVRDYLRIHESLMHGRLEVSVDVPHELLDVQVPRFCLQPLVENAIRHGLENSRCDGVVVVVVQSADTLELVVSDNGVGITDQELQQIRRRMEREEQADHIGLTSVHRRIQLLYGDQFGVTVSSKPGLGTTCTVRLPPIRRTG
jgi:two-component system, sensor histidine kinase YesM